MSNEEDQEPAISNKNHRLFADYYLGYGANATAAYARAYDKDLSNPNENAVCRTSGGRLLTKVDVRAYINYHMKKRALTKDDVLDKVRDIVSFNPLPYYNDDMSLNMAKIKEDGIGWMVEDIEIVETRNAKGQIERKMHGRFMKKQPNINNLLKVHGAYEKDNKQKGEQVHTIKGYAIISPDDWDTNKTD